jgi:hypothetical protein
MRRRELLLTAATGIAMVTLPIGLARANHVRIVSRKSACESVIVVLATITDATLSR